MYLVLYRVWELLCFDLNLELDYWVLCPVGSPVGSPPVIPQPALSTAQVSTAQAVPGSNESVGFAVELPGKGTPCLF